MFFRVKDITTSGYSKYIINPDKSLNYDIVQSYVNATVPKISSPLLTNWKCSLENVPANFNYTHLYEYIIKRTAVVLTKEMKECGTYKLPVADKPLRKGYNFYASGHIQEIKVNCTEGYCHIWSRVMASMKDQIYLTKIVLEEKTAVILTSGCNCVAGCGGKCNHIAAVLFALIEYRESQRTDSCTSKPQQWHLPSRKRKKQTKPQRIGRYFLSLYHFRDL